MTITAHVQHRQRRICSKTAAKMQCIGPAMRPEQKIIADWMGRVLAAKEWKPADWAREAKLGAPTTITRAMSEDCTSVTSVPTLHQLAVSAGEPSVLDFLEGAEPQPFRPGFSEEQLQQAADEAVEEVQAGMSIAEIRRVVAARLHELLVLDLALPSEPRQARAAPKPTLNA